MYTPGQHTILHALTGLGAGQFENLVPKVIGIVEVFTQYYLGSNPASAAIYVIFIAVLIFRPQGLFGKVGRV